MRTPLPGHSDVSFAAPWCCVHHWGLAPLWAKTNLSFLRLVLSGILSGQGKGWRRQTQNSCISIHKLTAYCVVDCRYAMMQLATQPLHTANSLFCEWKVSFSVNSSQNIVRIFPGQSVHSYFLILRLWQPCDTTLNFEICFTAQNRSVTFYM